MDTDNISVRNDECFVVVCLRHAELRTGVDLLTGEISRAMNGQGLSAADEAALEHGLRLAQRWSAQVLAVAAGGPEADQTLRSATALGARALRIDWPGLGYPAASPYGGDGAYVTDLVADERALARAIVSAVTSVVGDVRRSLRLVLCGDRSADRGTGTLTAYLAHEFRAAQVLGLTHLTDDGGKLVGERRLDGGRRERLSIPHGAVCSVEGAGVRLRRASLAGALAATGSVGPVVAPSVPSRTAAAGWDVTVGQPQPVRPRTRIVPPPEGNTPLARLRALSGVLTQHEPPEVIGPVDAAKAADVLLAFLRDRGYLDALPPGQEPTHG